MVLKHTHYPHIYPLTNTEWTVAADFIICQIKAAECFYLDTDSSCGLTQCQDGVVLGSVQPVDSQFGAGGPFHHGDIIFPPETTRWERTSQPLTTSVSATWRKMPQGDIYCLLLYTTVDLNELSCKSPAWLHLVFSCCPVKPTNSRWAVTHPIRGSSGFFITTVCRGPLRLTTDRCTTGFSSPACRGKQEVTQVSLDFSLR